MRQAIGSSLLERAPAGNRAVGTSRGARQHKSWSASTKRQLCDTVEALSLSGKPDDERRAELLPAVYRHAIALAEERAAGLPGLARDELVSTLGERVTVALRRLDLGTPPAQQAAYLDRLLHHALADACRSLDPLGRGPRALRRRYQEALEERAQAIGSVPATPERNQILDEVVGQAPPALRLVVGHGMHPAGAAARVTGSDGAVERSHPGETVVTAMIRRKIAKVIAAHPDAAVREYLFKVAAGAAARRPADFDNRLGPTLPRLLAALVAEQETQAASACR